MIIQKQIQIQSVRGQIGMESTSGRLEIANEPSQISIHNTPARLRIQREKPAVVIDAGECWNDRGHKTLERSLADNVAYSKGKVTGNIAAAANQGRRMADIGRSPDTRLLIAQIAGEKSARPMELRFARVPDSRPRIQVTGYLDMNWTGGDIQFDISRHQVTARHERRQLNIYLQTQPRLYIQIIDIRA